MTEQISYNLDDCLKCGAWAGTGCSLTACSKNKTFIYIDGKLVEIGELKYEEIENEKEK